MKKIYKLLPIIVLASFILTGCKKDKGEPPSLPPAESMIIDFSNFESGKKSEDVIHFKGIENSNWEFAALVAGYWETIIVTTLAVPVLAFHAAINQTPIYLENKTWEWSYNSTILGATYTARLTGQIRTSDVLWKMYISREGGTEPFSEFLWFDGTSDLDGTGGQWILNHSPQFREPVLQIDWTKTGTELGTVKYTYVRTLNDSRDPDPFKTSSIEYGEKTGTFDAYYIIHYFNGADFSDMEVEWSTTGHNGRVKCQKFFLDTEWHCWDGNYVNIVCQ
jgi:hypothetical protein